MTIIIITLLYVWYQRDPDTGEYRVNVETFAIFFIIIAVLYGVVALGFAYPRIKEKFFSKKLAPPTPIAPPTPALARSVSDVSSGKLVRLSSNLSQADLSVSAVSVNESAKKSRGLFSTIMTFFVNMMYVVMVLSDIATVIWTAVRILKPGNRGSDLFLMWLLLVGLQTHLSNLLFEVGVSIFKLKRLGFILGLVAILVYAVMFPLISISRIMTFSLDDGNEHHQSAPISQPEIDNLHFVVDFFGLTAAGATIVME